MGKQIPLHYQIAEKVMDLLEEGTHRQTVQDRLENGTIQQFQIEDKSFQLQGEIFISSADIYADLTLSAIKLIIQIQQELKMNNPLWECPSKNSPTCRAALALLKKKNILFPINGTDMYIVNPAKIRKGRPLSVYGALYQYSRDRYNKDKNWRITTEDIKRLQAPKQTLLPSTADVYLEGHT